ncbi:HamA C-terminal domain-containing protein [Rhizobium mongolense]
MGTFKFEILIDDSLSKVTSAEHLKKALNKRLLSFINDFEDGTWRFESFQNYIWDNIALTALSERERTSLTDQNYSGLLAAAKNLRLSDKDKKGEGSEIAEIFLYGVMRHHFNALPVVPKIFYKQNTQDNAKGADSVHIVVEGDDFTLWFGEAKFFNSIADARLDKIVKSVFQCLTTEKLKKENSIITSLSDLDVLPIDAGLRAKIKQALQAQHSIDHLKPKIHVPILIIHECEITFAQSELSYQYRREMIDFHQDRAEAYFTKQMAKAHTVHKYDDLTFHAILVPVPNKKMIVDAFTKHVSFFKRAK